MRTYREHLEDQANSSPRGNLIPQTVESLLEVMAKDAEYLIGVEKDLRAANAKLASLRTRLMKREVKDGS